MLTDKEKTARLRLWSGSMKSLDDPLGAIVQYNKSLLLEPTNPVGWLLRAEAKIAIGDLKGALNDLDQAITLKKDLAKGYFYKGFIKENVGQFDQAIENFNIAISLKKNFADALFHRGLVKHYLKDENAEADLTNASVQSKYKNEYANLNDLICEMNNYVNEIRQYETILINDPKNIKAYL